MLEIANQKSYPSDDFSLVENNAIAGQYMSRFWQPVAIAKNYPPGVAKRIKMLGDFYTLYRGEGGEFHLVQDRCPHRGTSLAYGWVEGDSIRCRYHGWKFAGDGQGEEFPAETATYARSICLKSYPVRNYLGAVFVYFGQDEPPEFPCFPELEDESAGELLVMAAILPYNYFQRIENDVDEVHIHFTHRDFMENFGLVDLPRISAQETEYGLVSTATRADGSTHLTHVFMPNVMLRKVAIQQDTSKLTIHAAWRVPIDDATMLSLKIDRVGKYDEVIRERERDMINPAELARQVMACEMTLDDIDQYHPMLPVVQDTVTCGGQGVIAERKNEHLGASDRAIVMLRRIWKRELVALSEGRTLKDWRRPDGSKPLPFAAEDMA